MLTKFKKITKIFYFLFSYFLFLMILTFSGITLVTGKSVDKEGIYYSKEKDTYKNNTIVLACLSNNYWINTVKQREYLTSKSFFEKKGNIFCKSHLPALVKQIVGVENDVIEIGAFGIKVNGRVLKNSKSLQQDSKGNKLRQLPYGKIKLRKNEYWLMSKTNILDGLDSRYFGQFRKKDILGELKPILVW